MRTGGRAWVPNAIIHAIDLIQTHPEIGTPRRSPLPSREILLTRFSYKLVYRVREHDLYIVAIAHTSRRPGYWKGRR